ncbi:unnamed protein product [Peronospora farinosa]|uniref:Uncharacterized protein n=1 Tax=Peronospora farinosa TaxID=134698 RepID=A0AAV0TEZ8_9STRA|nr:unnamed protein product [Peronospora farinosa]
MQRAFSAACTTVAMAAFAFNTVDAHGYVSNPLAKFVDESILTKYVKTITADVNSAFGGLKWDDSPEANVATFTSAFVNTGYKSLRDMLDQQVSDCANTRTDTSPVDVSGLTVMKWQNDEEQKGFIDSHHGPCEVWIDDIMVDHQDDCVAAYGSGYPANVKVDFFKCSGNCILRFYWLALHEIKWQVYKQCVPIMNNSGMQTQTEVQGTVKPADIKTEVPGPVTPASTQMETQTETQPQSQSQTQSQSQSQPQSQSQTQSQPQSQPQSQSQTQVQDAVIPASTTSKNASESNDGCQNRALRNIEDAPTHLANGAKVNWADNRFLRAFNEFAAGFQRND